MTNRFELKRALLAGLAAIATLLAFVLVAGTSPASANHVSTWPSSSEANHASYWEQWGSDQEGEDDWTCVKDDRGSEGAYTIGSPPDGSDWRLLVVKAGNDVNDLHWDPSAGDSFEHSIQGGWSHVIECSRPTPTTTTAPEPSTTDSQPTTTEAPSTTVQPTTTEAPSTTVPEPSTTEATVSPTSITSPPSTAPPTTAEVLPTSITSAPPTTEEIEPVDTLPFTGVESGTPALLALALIGIGALALVGTRRAED